MASKRFLVYQLIFPNGKSYIGQTGTSLKKRIWYHRNRQTSYPVNNAIKKYQDFKVLVLESNISVEDICTKERHYILKLNSLCPNGYNLDLPKETGLGKIVHDSTKEKLKILNSGKNNPRYGTKDSEEVKKKRSNSLQRYYSSKKNRERQSKILKNYFSSAKYLESKRKFKAICKNTGKVAGEFQTIKEAQEQLNININIGRVLSGKRKSAGGYYFSYVNSSQPELGG